jgi:hypothetical protein
MVLGMFLNQAFVDRMIQNQHRAIRYYLCFAIALVVLGVVLVVFGSRASRWLMTDAAKDAIQIGGGFVSTLGAIPVKELIARKEKLGIFEIIKVRLLASQVDQDNIAEPERQRIDNLLWQLIEKTALG